MAESSVEISAVLSKSSFFPELGQENETEISSGNANSGRYLSSKETGLPASHRPHMSELNACPSLADMVTKLPSPPCQLAHHGTPTGPSMTVQSAFACT